MTPEGGFMAASAPEGRVRSFYIEEAEQLPVRGPLQLFREAREGGEQTRCRISFDRRQEDGALRSGVQSEKKANVFESGDQAKPLSRPFFIILARSHMARMVRVGEGCDLDAAGTTAFAADAPRDEMAVGRESGLLDGAHLLERRDDLVRCGDRQRVFWREPEG